MTTQTTPYASAGSKKTTVGCGCGNKNCGGDCHCGSSSDANCGCNEGLLVQPHFFAGQLLTDDDLQALTNYTVAKHRLHNRYVTGSGVSCGLAVTCHPCGNGKVIVQPGYAIDCCGNDIYVPCPVELDINAMVRDLTLKRLGHDCGDPCVDAMKKKEPMGEVKAVVGRRSDCADAADRYCLYLNYCEQPTDPVTPYTQDESCATSCQPSRIREGFNFELRCPEEDETPLSVVDRIRCCIGDLNEAEFQSREIERSEVQFQRANIAVQAFEAQKPAEFTSEDVDIIINVQEELAHDAPLFLSTGTGEVGNAMRPASRENKTVSDGEAIDKSVLTEKVLRRSLDNVQKLGSAISRYELEIVNNNEEKIKQLGLTHSDLNDKINSGRQLLQDVAPEIGKRAPQYLTSSIELATADATVANTLIYINPELELVQRQSFEAYLYAYNNVSSSALTNQHNNTLANFKNWLLRKMQKCPPTTECCLIEEVGSVVIPTIDRINESTFVAADTLVRAFIRYLLDCICSALIPPCPTCEDTSVKLACLEIKDCKVDNICNLERTFLLTEHNLRYWLPFLHGFGEALENICCEFSQKFDKPIRTFDVNPIKQAAIKNAEFFAIGEKVSNALAEQPAYTNILRLTGLSDNSVKPVINFSNSLGNIVIRQPQLTDLFEQKNKLQAANGVGNIALEKLFERQEVKTAIQVTAENQLSLIEKKLETSTAEKVKSVEEMEERNSSRILELDADLRKRVTTNGLPSTKVIKELQASLEEQKKVNKTLATRLDKLEKDAK